MIYHNLLGQQTLADALPLPHDMLGSQIHGTLILSTRSCSALVSTGTPRTLIRLAYARGVGFYSLPRYGDFAQQSDGSWSRVIEHYHPSLRISVSGIHWKVRAIEGDTGPFDLILGTDWLHEHRVLVDVFRRSITLDAPGGRVVLQFVGHPAILSLTDYISNPPVTPMVPPEPEYEPEEEDEAEMEEPWGNGFIEVDDMGGISDVDVD